MGKSRRAKKKRQKQKKEAEVSKATASRVTNKTTEGNPLKLFGEEKGETLELQIPHPEVVNNIPNKESQDTIPLYTDGKSPFSQWIKSDLFKKLIPKEGQRINKLVPVDSEFYIAKDRDQNPLCIFEVLKEVSEDANFNKLMLGKYAPTRSIKTHGYGVLYNFNKTTKQFRFNVRKFTPTERFCGFFDERGFAKFVASTIHILVSGLKPIRRRR